MAPGLQAQRRFAVQQLKEKAFGVSMSDFEKQDQSGACKTGEIPAASDNGAIIRCADWSDFPPACLGGDPLPERPQPLPASRWGGRGDQTMVRRAQGGRSHQSPNHHTGVPSTALPLASAVRSAITLANGVALQRVATTAGDHDFTLRRSNPPQDPRCIGGWRLFNF